MGVAALGFGPNQLDHIAGKLAISAIQILAHGDARNADAWRQLVIRLRSGRVAGSLVKRHGIERCVERQLGDAERSGRCFKLGEQAQADALAYG